MTATRIAAALAAFSLLLLVAAPAQAREAGERLPHPSLQPRALDLIPLGDIERAAFNKEHGTLVYRATVLGKRVKGLDGKVKKLSASRAKAKDKKKVDAEIKKAQAERRRIALQASALMARLTDELVEDGMEPALIPVLNAAPIGAGRLDRHGRSLVLMLPDLTPAQWRLFERAVAQTEGAWHVITANKERTLLALKQTELKKNQVTAVGSTFDRQLRLMDKRFWQLVDFTLTQDQRGRLWQYLPQRLRRKSQPQEHLYALAGLSPSQATRLKSLMTEIEAESSPDNAAVKRANVQLRDKKLAGKARKQVTDERAAAYRRLAALRKFATEETRKILAEDQWAEYLAIPPRLSINDRRASNNRVLQGFKPSPVQQKQIKALSDEVRKHKRASQKRIAELRRSGADYGPDSPQMMSMQMMMAGEQAGGARHQRDLLGRVFLEVLSPDEVTHWLMGHWGYKN